MMSFLSGMFSSFDIIIATSPQFFTAVSAGMISLLRNKKFVFEVRDLWPESIVGVEVMKENFLIKILSRVEKLLYRRAWKIVVVSEGFIPTIVNMGIDPSKIYCISNGISKNNFYPRDKNKALLSKLHLEEKFVVGYVGTHGMAHKLDFIIDCIGKLENDRIHFLFIGEGAKKEELIKQAAQLGLKNITFINNIARDQVSAYLSLLDVGLIHLRVSDAFEKVIPSKLFELAAMGIPVLMGVKGEASRLVLKYTAGVCFEPENENDFISKFTELKNNQALRDKVKTGGALLAKDFNREALAQKMFELFRS
jgi:glycosyltransferase involved in cell wall biosynthesis